MIFGINGSLPRLTHLDAIAGTMFSVGGRQMEQIRAVLRQQRVAGEVSAEAACGRFFLGPEPGTGRKK